MSEKMQNGSYNPKPSTTPKPQRRTDVMGLVVMLQLAIKHMLVYNDGKWNWIVFLKKPISNTWITDVLKAIHFMELDYNQ